MGKSTLYRCDFGSCKSEYEVPEGEGVLICPSGWVSFEIKMRADDHKHLKDQHQVRNVFACPMHAATMLDSLPGASVRKLTR